MPFNDNIHNAQEILNIDCQDKLCPYKLQTVASHQTTPVAFPGNKYLFFWLLHPPDRCPPIFHHEQETGIQVQSFSHYLKVWRRAIEWKILLWGKKETPLNRKEKVVSCFCCEKIWFQCRHCQQLGLDFLETVPSLKKGCCETGPT